MTNINTSEQFNRIPFKTKIYTRKAVSAIESDNHLANTAPKKSRGEIIIHANCSKPRLVYDFQSQNKSKA